MTATVSLAGRLHAPATRPAGDFGDPSVIWTGEPWRRFVERTDLHDVRYLSVEEDGEPVALAPLLRTSEPGGLLFYDPPRLIGTEGAMADPARLDPDDRQRWARLTADLGSVQAANYPTLALATFGNHLGVAHAAGRSADQRRAVLAALPGLLAEAADQLGCRSSAMLYGSDADAEVLGSAAESLGYQQSLLGAEGVQHLTAGSAEEYEAGLRSRRRTRYRRELRDFRDAGFRTVVRHGGEALTEEIVALQVAHRAKYGLPGGEERVRRDFAGIRADLGDRCLLFVAERDGVPAGFVLYLRTADAIFARTAGFAADARGAYLALTYHETANWACANGIRRVHYGLAAAEAKWARGCDLDPRWGWFRFTGSPVLSELLRLQGRSIVNQLDQVRAGGHR